MVALLKCPNCGAPLQGSGSESRHACAYCGALLELPKPAPTAPVFVPQPAPAPVRAATYRPLLWVMGTVSLTSIVGWVLGFGVLKSSAPAVKAAPLATRAAQAAPEPRRVAFARLEGIDIRASVEQAKAKLPVQFPEAEVKQDKDYRLALDHPILSSVSYSWSWGCACLDGAVFFFKDYPTRMKTKDAFIPCLERGLGPIAKSAPPFDYEWAARAGAPLVHLGPQTLSLNIERDTTPAGYASVLRVLGACRD